MNVLVHRFRTVVRQTRLRELGFHKQSQLLGYTVTLNLINSYKPVGVGEILYNEGVRVWVWLGACASTRIHML